MIDLIPPKVACFAGMNMCVSASSWLQGDTKSVFIALLLTTFVISVIFRTTEICKISCSGNSKLFKSVTLHCSLQLQLFRRLDHVHLKKNIIFKCMRSSYMELTSNEIIQHRKLKCYPEIF